jgi:hypothetical protein
MSSTLLFRWTAVNTSDGTLFYPPEGRAVAGIHVRERLRPLERVRSIVAVAKNQLAPILEITDISPPVASVTDEGEYAAIVDVHGRARNGGHAMRYVLGFVFGDDFYDRIDGYFNEAQAGDYETLMRDYVRAYRLNLGALRARRYHYDPPEGWQGRARNMLAQWFSLDYPRRPSQIIIPAAFPSSKIEASVTARALIQRRLVAFKQEHEDIEPLASPGMGMAIHHVRGTFANDPSITDLCTIVATDERYVYVARLETSAQWLEQDRATLIKLASSIKPLPRPKADEPVGLSWMAE